MFSNSALSRIQSEEGQLTALSLMVEHAKVLQTVIADKDALKKVSDMLSDFDKKHAEVHEMLNEKAVREQELDERQVSMDAAEKRMADEHAKKMADLAEWHRSVMKQNEDNVALDRKNMDDVHESRTARIAEANLALSSREGAVRRSESALDVRSGALNELADKLNARQAELEARHEALSAFSAKVEARHEEVSAAEKNALRG